VTTIADALLLADGVHVARFNNASWEVSARGFNSASPNKLLVMVDGVTVYSPLFTGVFWNMQDYVLEDIDRIEVIRGPGATLWGANAVNGVVNIITRHSRETRRALVNLSTGNEDRAIVEARYGAGLAGGTTWRAYGKFASRDQQLFSDGLPSGDGRTRGQAGFRIDGATGRGDWLVKGDAFHSLEDLPDREAGEFTELRLQGRWTATLRGGSRLAVQSYYQREYRRVIRQLTHRLDTVDVDAQHSFILAARHDVVWGGGARGDWDTTNVTPVFRFTPQQRAYPLVNVFVQDEFSLVPRRVFVTAGVKYEHNVFSGGELQPNLRARVVLPARQTLWGAVSRAVRRPTRFDDDIEVLAPNGAVLIRGSDDFVPERLIATEVGYRVSPVPIVSIDATAYVHRYANIRSQELPAAGFVPLVIGNTLDGRSHGLELGVNVQPTTWWRTHASYTWLASTIARAPGSRDVSGGVNERNDPDYLFGLRTSIDLPHGVEFDAHLRSVAALPDPAVPAFTELNLRVGWAVTRRADVWITGQDLLHDAHPEFGAALPRRVEYERGIRAGLTVRY
jgi:iron complex outermembrane receptor protein